MKQIYIILGVIIFIGIISNVNSAQAAEGDIWLTTTDTIVEAGEYFDVEIHTDTGGKKLGGFDFGVNFDSSKLSINKTINASSIYTDSNGNVSLDVDSIKGFGRGNNTQNYMMMSNTNDTDNGNFRISGIKVEDEANGNNVHVATIHMQVKGDAVGNANIDLEVNGYLDELGHAINVGNISGLTVTIAKENLYRFWSKKNQSHFYTANEEERDYIMSHYDDYVWHYEGVANDVFATQVPNSVPVYRFWSKKNQGHFYTASEEEKNLVINKYDDYVWKYEGVAYYAYPTPQPNSIPIYRFWSKKNQHHFYTASEEEKNLVINKYDDYVWKYEGVAWYAKN